MSNLALSVGGASLALVAGGWVHYLASIPKEKVPARPVVHSSIMILGIVAVLGTFGFALSQGYGPGGVAWILGASAVGLAAFFLYLLTQAPMPDKPIQVAVGDPLLPIVAKDAAGQEHRSDEWKGSRVLFKFFRGHW